MNFYEMAQQLMGTLPAQYEFLYAFGAVVLFLMAVYVLLFPLIFLGKLSDK